MIINQVLIVKDYIRGSITNVVFMGMGEPLDNMNAVIKAIEILSENNSLAFGMRKLTVSTCGLIPQMFEFKKRCSAKLAISLNASNDYARDKLMPINKRYSLGDLMGAIKSLPLKNHEFITIEYVLFKGLND